MNQPDRNEPATLVQKLFVENMMALRGYVLALMPDFARVDDIVQETFVTATAKAGDFQPGTNFKAWIFTIARYKVLQALDDPQSARLALTPEVIEALSVEENEDTSLEDRLQALSGCVQKLSPQARRVIEFRYQNAHRPPQIAQIMGWTLNAVNVALARARVSLRDCVERRIKPNSV
jgi:RNA polymerase sigma-70 factor (ECF subfamily)